MNQDTVVCKIEHHAVLFALLSKYAMTLRKEEGKEAILKGMTRYGNERGRRMAKNAIAHGDPLTTMTNQLYGEWKPDYEGQMEFGQLQTEPALKTYISRCAWCDAWKKHDLLEFGKYYCVNVDNAVYQGFRPDFVCTPTTTSLSFGGERCEFDWGHPVTTDEIKVFVRKKKEIGTSCMKDFNFHTAHLLHTVGDTLMEELGDDGAAAVKKAEEEYVQKFGQEYLDILKEVDYGRF